MSSLEIIYDDEAQTLEFIKDKFSVCVTSVEAFNSVYSSNFTRLQSAFMPPAVRQIGQFGDKTYIFYEERPQYRSIQFTPDKLEQLALDLPGSYQYYLPIPWTLFVVQLSIGNEIEEIYGYITRPNSESFEDTSLYQIPLHNWYNDCKLCRPMYNHESVQKHNDILSVLNQVHNEIWNSGYNNDLVDNIEAYSNRLNQYHHPFIDREHLSVLNKLMTNDRDMFYNYFYSAWANVHMDQMLTASYCSMGSVGEIFGHTLRGKQSVTDSTRFTSELLIAAQNSSMIK